MSTRRETPEWAVIDRRRGPVVLLAVLAIIASLFAAACESGSLLSGDTVWAERFRSFGELVGLGFQRLRYSVLRWS